MALRQLLGASMAVAALFAAASVSAVGYTWNNAGGGVFANAANWTPAGGPPGYGDIATFNLAGTYTVTFDSNEETSELHVDAGTVTFDMNGFTYSAGRTISTGAYPTHHLQDSIIIKDADLVVTGGGELHTDVTDSYDYALRILGTGSLTIEGGSKVRDTQGPLSYQYFGWGLSNYGVDVGGSLIVDGAGSEFHGYGYYGFSVDGDITVLNGGLVHEHRRGLQTNYVHPGTWTVDGAGSRIIVQGGIVSGYGGVVRLDISNGGEVEVIGSESLFGGVMLVGNPGGPNTIEIGGAGSAAVLTVNSYWLDMGSGGWDLWGGHAEVKVVVNGTLEALGLGGIAVGDGSPYVGTASVLTLDGGGVEMCGNTLHVQGDAQVPSFFPQYPGGDGVIPLLRGQGTIASDAGGCGNFTLLNDGRIKPGDVSAAPAIGELTVSSGDLVNSATGTIYLEFDGAGNDAIAISGGTADLGGSLSFATLAFTPVQGSGLVWDFVVADSISYSAADNIASLFGGWTAGVDYRYGVVSSGGGQALRLEICADCDIATLLLSEDICGALPARPSSRQQLRDAIEAVAAGPLAGIFLCGTVSECIDDILTTLGL